MGSPSSEGRWPGVPLALASAILFGVSTPVAKALLGEVQPVVLAGLLYLGSGVGLWTLRRIVGSRRTANEPTLQRGDAPVLAFIVVLGGMAGPLLLMIGLAATPASTASLLLNLEGVFTLGIAWVVFRENVDLRIGAGAAAILGAAVLLSWSAGPEAVSWRSLSIAGACLAWAIDNNLTRKLSNADPVQLAMIKGLGAGALNAALGMMVGAQWPQISAALAAGAVGLLGYGVSLVCFILALRHLGTARTGAYFSVAPFVGAIVAVAALGESITPRFLVAAALMAAGLYLHVTERHEHEHVHEPMAHEHRHVHDAHHQHAHAPGDPAGEPHTHWHEHSRLVHSHPHYPDMHHRHHH
jgi:drug/metabolite transporter (DMT)-like permease